MQVMVIMKGEPPEERAPDEAMVRVMGEFNRQLADAGVLIGGEGLRSSRHARRVRLAGDGPEVVDGPFAETKELLAGFWMFHVDSWDEAIDWLQRSPLAGSGFEVELRQVGDYDNLGPGFTPALQQYERETRAIVARNVERVHVTGAGEHAPA